MYADWLIGFLNSPPVDFSFCLCKTLLIRFSLYRQLDGETGEKLAGTDWDQVQLQVREKLYHWFKYHRFFWSETVR